MLRQEGIRLTTVGDAQQHSSYVEDVGLLPSYGFKLVRKLNPVGIAHFTRRLTGKQPARYYSAAKIAVVTSLYEGFGIRAAEAMVCGTPVIATTGGALPEVSGQRWHPGTTGRCPGTGCRHQAIPQLLRSSGAYSRRQDFC